MHRWQMGVLSDNQKTESLEKAGERKTGGKRRVGHEKNRWAKETKREKWRIKRGHWRQIKDTQLNEWMDGPLDLNGHLHPPSVPVPQGRKMSALGLRSSASHHQLMYTSKLIVRATGTSQYATLCSKAVPFFLACSANTHTHTHWREK